MFINDKQSAESSRNSSSSAEDLAKVIATFKKLQLNRAVPEFIEENGLELKLFDALDIGVYIIDYSSGKYVYVNESFAKILGLSKHDILDQHISVLSGSVHAADFDSLISVMIKTGEFIRKIPKPDRNKINFKVFYRIKKGNGSSCWCMQSNKIIEDFTSDAKIDIGTINCLPEHHSVDRVAAYLKIGIKNIEILPGNEEVNPLSALSKREREVLNLVGKGFSSREISEKLKLSEETIKIHRKRVLRKLKVNSSIHAIRILQKYGRSYT